MRVLNVNDNYGNEVVLSIQPIDTFASGIVQEIQKADAFAQTESKPAESKPAYALTVEPLTDSKPTTKPLTDDKPKNTSITDVSIKKQTDVSAQSEIVSKSSRTQLPVKTDGTERNRKINWLEIFLITAGVGVLAWILLKREAKEPQTPKEQQPKTNQT
ncbi:MAG: hypothetical protein RMJ97_06955 [Raineya sp.]|nr:hypothetical protein [Raineya sp.]